MTQQSSVTILLSSLSTTSRSLMPGSSKDSDPDDLSLNQTFRADKIEFLLVSRPATPAEANTKHQILNVNTSDWDIPKDEEYEDAMGCAIAEFTKTDSDLIHVICWSSVNKATDTGVVQCENWIAATHRRPEGYHPPDVY